MGDELAYLKAEIHGISATVAKKFPTVRQRFSLQSVVDHVLSQDGLQVADREHLVEGAELDVGRGAGGFREEAAEARHESAACPLEPVLERFLLRCLAAVGADHDRD